MIENVSFRLKDFLGQKQLLKSNFRKSKEIADLNSRLARIEAKITPVS